MKDETMSDEKRPRTECRVERAAGERTIVAELDLPADPGAVWSAITEGDEIASWFAFQARSETGPDGEIWLSWDGLYEDTLPIRLWQPDEHLRIGWHVEDPKSGDRRELVVDWYLESLDGGGTRLRLVHTGFGEGDEWDDIVDGHRSGWAVELRCLRHYLEHHRGRRRGLVRAECAIPGPKADAWRRLLSAPGWLAQGSLDVGEDESFEAVTASGERLTGRVLLSEEPTDLACALQSLESGFLRLGIGQWPGDEGDRVRLWLLSWRLAEEERDRLQREWQEALEALFVD